MKKKIIFMAGLLIAGVCLYGQVTPIQNVPCRKGSESLKRAETIIANYTKPPVKHEAKKQLDSLITEKYDAALLKWTKEYKEVFTYNSKRDIALYLYYSWNDTMNEWFPLNRTQYEYNQNNRLTSWTYSEYHPDNIWLGVLREEYSYNQDGKLTEVTYFTSDKDMQKWICSSKEIFEWSPEGEITTFIEKKWNYGAKQWLAATKNAYTYNSMGYLSCYVFSIWSDEYNKWVADYKEESGYNVNNELTSVISSSWDYLTNGWTPGNKTEFCYDSISNLVTIMTYTWDINSSIWNQNYKYNHNYLNKLLTESKFYQWNALLQQWDTSSYITYTYNNKELLLSTVYSIWNTNNHIWEYSWKEENEYDSSGFISKYTLSEWNSLIPVWVAQIKTEFDHDAFGNLTGEKQMHWDSFTSGWFGINQNEYSYNNNYNVINLVIPYWLGEKYIPFKQMLTTGLANIWNTSSNKWEHSKLFTLYYGDFLPVYVNHPQYNPSFTISPNPCKDYFRIGSENITLPALVMIYNLQGDLMMEKQFTNDENICINNLSAGTYFCVVKSVDEVIRGTLIVQ